MKTRKINNPENCIKLLKYARVHIVTELEPCTCYALDRANESLKLTTDFRDLMLWISDLLNEPPYPSMYLETWLMHRKYITTDEEWALRHGLASAELKKKVRATRLAWIDWMIAELEAIK